MTGEVCKLTVKHRYFFFKITQGNPFLLNLELCLSTEIIPSCCVKECRVGKSNNQATLTFHRFPANGALKKKWIDIIGTEIYKPSTSVTNWTSASVVDLPFVKPVFVYKLQTPLSEYSLVCRGCLAESGEMKSIREWGLTDDFYKLTDILLPNTEGISELLCTSCEDSLMMCKRFRSQCQQSDIVLRNIAKRKAEEATPQDQTINTITFTFDEDQLTFTIQAPDPEAKITLPCPYDCRETYIKKTDLHTHLVKRHNLKKDYVIDVKYFCYHEDCAYNEKSPKKKWFSKRKFLNQHYNKVHRNKIFLCDKCNRKFSLVTDYNRHLNTCNILFKCELCDITYNCNERLMVHLMRHHPDLHKQYKNAKKAEKRKANSDPQKRLKTATENYDYIFDSPKRSFATQTLENTIKNDVTLLSWQNTPSKSDSFTKTDEISTQTVFEDLLSLKSQSEDDSMFFSETVSLSDIQTQTFPIEFGSSRSNKETLTDPDMSIKETQTCFCRFDSPKPHFRLFDSVASSPAGGNLTSTETQTHEFRSNISDVLLSFSSAETQTCFDDDSKDM